MTASYTDATGLSDDRNPAILWHPRLSIQRVDQLAVASPNLGGSDRSWISPGVRRIHCERNDYQPYVGTVTSQIHGQANFRSGKIYFAHQNLARGRLEIIELPDDFKLPQSSMFLLNPAYEKSFQEAEKVHKASIIPNLFLSTSETK